MEFCACMLESGKDISWSINKRGIPFMVCSYLWGICILCRGCSSSIEWSRWRFIFENLDGHLMRPWSNGRAEFSRLDEALYFIPFSHLALQVACAVKLPCQRKGERHGLNGKIFWQGCHFSCPMSQPLLGCGQALGCMCLQWSLLTVTWRFAVWGANHALVWDVQGRVRDTC